MTNKRVYKFIYCLLRPIGKLFIPQKTIGRENIPQGACILCANHSNAVDPVLLAFSLGKNDYVHFLAKAEAKKIPVINWILRKIESIYVRRGERDIDAVKQCMKALKANEKLMLFPEGTRVHGENRVKPQTGAIHLSVKMQVPLVPVYIPRDKKVFCQSTVVIGEPYMPSVAQHIDYQEMANELMERIFSLKEKTDG